MSVPKVIAKRPTGYAGNLTVQQRKALAALKEALEPLQFLRQKDHVSDADDVALRPPDAPGDPVAPGTRREEAAEAEMLAQSRSGLLRFLRARDFDVMKARELAITSCKWRASVRPWALEPGMMPEALPSGAWRFGGHTKAGMPVLLFDGGAWSPRKYRFGLDEFVRYAGYFVEGALGRMGPGVEQICMIWSVGSWSEELMAPFAVRCMAQLLYILQTVYPERIGAVFLCGVNQLFQGYFFRILRPWMSHRFLSMFRFLSEIDTLHQFVDASQLPRSLGALELGGTHEEFPIPCRSVADEIDDFIADLGGPECLPIASGAAPSLLAPQQLSFRGDVSGTHMGEVDLLLGKPYCVEMLIAETTVAVDWHITGSLHGVVFGFKVCELGFFGEKTVEEGTGTADEGTPTMSPAKAGAIEGNLVIKQAWAGCTLKLILYSSYSREDCKQLQYCIGIQAR